MDGLPKVRLPIFLELPTIRFRKHFGVIKNKNTLFGKLPRKQGFKIKLAVAAVANVWALLTMKPSSMA